MYGWLEGHGIPAWAIEAIISAVIIVAAWIASAILLMILGAVKKHLAKRTETTLDDEIIDALRKPVRWVAIFIGVAIAAQRLDSKFADQVEWAFRLTDGVVFVLIAYVVMTFLLKMIGIFAGWYGRTIAVKTESSADEELIPLVNRILRIIIFVMALVTVLDHFNVDVKGLLAVLGVGSLAIALAAQDTIANMISGFILMLDRPFRKGDRVVLPSGDLVDVYDIGLRSSKFLTFENTLVIVPNNDLTKSLITNKTYPVEQIRVKVDVGVAYGSDINQVKEILIKCAKAHPEVVDDPAPGAFFLNFGDSSLDFTLICRVDKVSKQFTTGEEIRCAIYDEFEKAGIEIPFPQRVVYMRREDGEDSNVPRENAGQVS